MMLGHLYKTQNKSVLETSLHGVMLSTLECVPESYVFESHWHHVGCVFFRPDQLPPTVWTVVGPMQGTAELQLLHR